MAKMTLKECDWNKCDSGIKELSKHKWHCPDCDVHLTSLLLCPECGIRYDAIHISTAAPDRAPWRFLDDDTYEFAYYMGGKRYLWGRGG